jgi:hypothetical protein
MSRVVFALLCSSILPCLAEAQSMPEAAAQLAARISSLLQRRSTVSLDFQNLTALPPAEWSSFRSGLEQELRKAGLAVATTQPEVRLRVTISENTRGLLFVAEVVIGDARQVVMLPWSAPAPVEEKRQLQLTRKLIWNQSEPILDFLLLDSGSQLLILTASKVSITRFIDGKWVPSSQAALALAKPLARDPRGRIQNTADTFRIYVPGTTCFGVLQPAIKLTCSATNETWLASPRDSQVAVRWVTNRNFLESDGFRDKFFTSGGGLFTGTDGRNRDRAGEVVAGAGAWGSDIAGVENLCGPSTLLVAAKGGDDLDRDQIQAYEIGKAQVTPASEPMDLPGPVTALWPSESRGQATLVIRNSKTGNYEASLLGIACTQ